MNHWFRFCRYFKHPSNRVRCTWLSDALDGPSIAIKRRHKTSIFRLWEFWARSISVRELRRAACMAVVVLIWMVVLWETSLEMENPQVQQKDSHRLSLDIADFHCQVWLPADNPESKTGSRCLYDSTRHSENSQTSRPTATILSAIID